jgi:hypothetical protein
MNLRRTATPAPRNEEDIMARIIVKLGVRRSVRVGFAGALLASVSVLGAGLIPLGSATAATAAPTVKGVPCVSTDTTNSNQCQDTVTGTGFTPGGPVNLFVYRQSPALVGPGAAGGTNLLTTQVVTSTSPKFRPPRCYVIGTIRYCVPGFVVGAGSFSVTFDNPDSSSQTTSCGTGDPVTNFTIEVQDAEVPSIWATATYSSYGYCLR